MKNYSGGGQPTLSVHMGGYAVSFAGDSDPDLVIAYDTENNARILCSSTVREVIEAEDETNKKIRGSGSSAIDIAFIAGRLDIPFVLTVGSKEGLLLQVGLLAGYFSSMLGVISESQNERISSVDIHLGRALDILLYPESNVVRFDRLMGMSLLPELSWLDDSYSF